MNRWRLGLAVVAIWVSAAAACGGGADPVPCQLNTDCGQDERCEEGLCRLQADAGAPDGG